MKKRNSLYLHKYASILYRLGQIYFDMELSPCHIGCGQQFFLLRIHEEEGISVLDLAQKGYFDKGTTARAVKKLEEQKYIKRQIDTEDKRVSRLYVTQEGLPIIEATYKALDSWMDIMTEGMDKEEKAQASILMEKMAENANRYMKQRKKEHNE